MQIVCAYRTPFESGPGKSPGSDLFVVVAPEYLFLDASIQRVEQFTTSSGLNNLEFGLRLRYEMRREFAPYVGFSLDRSFGKTATLVRQESGNPTQIRFVAGLRMWL